MGKAEYVNGIIFGSENVNVLKYTETRIQDGVKKATKFERITRLEITVRNAEKLAKAGRIRWKIKNQGFNRQKRWRGDIGHACSFHEKAQKNHYLLEQISDFIKQLYEYWY